MLCLELVEKWGEGYAVAQLVWALLYKPECSSIPIVVISIFNCSNPSGNTKALEATQSLTEMSTRGISWE